MSPEDPKDDWDRLIEERDDSRKFVPDEEPKVEQWARFFGALVLFIFLFAVLDISPLMNLIFNPCDTSSSVLK